MAIHYQIPHKARYITISNIFHTDFGAYTPGKYDFTTDIANNANVQSLKLANGSVYLLDRISAGGNVAGEDYLSGIDTFPTVEVKRSLSNIAEYVQPIPIVQYFDNTDCASWIYSDKKDDWMTLTFKGVLHQTPSMVGLVTLKIQISFHVFEINDAGYVREFRDKVVKSGTFLRG